ncbi:MAG: hypothetical protein ACFE9X_16915 [Promethearchaeota archaeon]
MVHKQKGIMKILTILTYFILIMANFILLNLILPFNLDHVIEDGDSINNNTFQNLLITPKIANNDTTAPIITFIQPSKNYTTITQNSYTIIVNISDENPPLYGNVTIKISNLTNTLFDTLMNNTEGEQWVFYWENISLYPNYKTYILQVWAKDSSSSGNGIWSEEFYVYISVSEAPPLLNIILYFIAVSVIFAVIIVYMNRKVLRKSYKKERKQTDGFLEE